MIYEELCLALFAVHQPVMPVVKIWLCKGHSNPESHTQRFMNDKKQKTPYHLYHLVSIKCHKIIVIL